MGLPKSDKERSKIKMVVLTKHGYDNLTQYSPLKQNNKPSAAIIEGMLRRLKKNEILKVANVIQFYENNQVIHELKK